MLKNLRGFSNTKLAGVLIAIIIVPFVFWGMGSVFSGGNTNNVAKINNKSISTQDFLQYVNQSRINLEYVKENGHSRVPTSNIKRSRHNGLGIWVSNQRAFDLMKEGILPPETSNPDYNKFYEMIDAQLTTEIFGLYSPNYPDIGLRMAYMPIRTVGRENAAWISEFYIIMHSLASLETDHQSLKDKLIWMSEKARYVLPNSSYSAKMYDFVKAKYEDGISWEITRDSLNLKYQINNEDGYNWSVQEKNCNGCYAAGINFGASIISLLYGEGNFKETIKIASLCGWDSDNPASTWGGLLGFIYGKKEIVKMFKEDLSTMYYIGRTRIGFKNEVDSFESMAEKGLKIIDKVVANKHLGEVKNNKWVFKKHPSRFTNEYVDDLPEAGPPDIDLPKAN